MTAAMSWRRTWDLMWHGPETADGGPLLRAGYPSTTADVSCVGCGTIPSETGMKFK